METAQERPRTNAERLEEYKGTLLAAKPLFETFGFYMPDFEKAVSEITDLERAEKAVYNLYRLQIHGDGETMITDAALKDLEDWKRSITYRLMVSSESEELLQHELAHLGKSRFVPLPGNLQKQADANPHLPWPKRYETGFADAANGYDYKSLQDYFLDVAQSGFSSALFPEEGGIYLNPTMLNNSHFEDAVSGLLRIVKTFSDAHKRKFLKKVETLQNAGKEMAEIRAELMPNEESDNGAPDEKTDAKTPFTPPDAAAATETQNSDAPAEKTGAEPPSPPTNTTAANNAENSGETPEMSHLEIALLHYYKDEPITPINAPEIAYQYGYKAGRALYNKYNEITHRPARLLHGKDAKQLLRRQALLEKIRPQISPNKQLETELKDVTKRANKKK